MIEIKLDHSYVEKMFNEWDKNDPNRKAIESGIEKSAKHLAKKMEERAGMQVTVGVGGWRVAQKFIDSETG